MDDLKIFSKNKKRQGVYTNGQNFQPGYKNGVCIGKHTLMIMNRWKMEATEGIDLANQEFIGT